jgi:hypothetical protein
MTRPSFPKDQNTRQPANKRLSGISRRGGPSLIIHPRWRVFKLNSIATICPPYYSLLTYSYLLLGSGINKGYKFSFLAVKRNVPTPPPKKSGFSICLRDFSRFPELSELSYNGGFWLFFFELCPKHSTKVGFGL